MKKIILLIVVVVLYSCSTSKSKVDMPLYEILTVNNDGGANIKFYEILTEPKEIMMLLDDETLKSKIKKQDTKNASFIILNAGPTKENYNRIKIEKVIETSSQIEVYVKDSQKNIPSDLSNDDSFRPYTVVKVNSKKAIVIK